ncbi:hypothetical protein AArcSl_1650 [Halalkaliarchaeum desulfuricum]|uniref:Uncharacterized protein n=1 Tax=Halalkaliarchaeum desulfuricum TaxID=2055893 RepID=A0A343TJK7_9EURY|nr:hypothetical protein [Halalkaliarchaeum desulfuricum]AUX09279.1 hypothetical protein AArcSl_1650 [Halalkaliarchaeum desulfuricum]
MSKADTSDELVPVHVVAYEKNADLEIDNSGEDATVVNHDELVDKGQTYQEIRALARSAAEEYDLDIVEPGDPLWDDRFNDLESGDSWRLEEIRG